MKLAATPGESEPSLPAQSVLDKLVAAFTEQAPQLTRDPIGFFAHQLRMSFPPDISEKPGEDIYDLSSVIRRVERIRLDRGGRTGDRSPDRERQKRSSSLGLPRRIATGTLVCASACDIGTARDAD